LAPRLVHRGGDDDYMRFESDNRILIRYGAIA
jgi:hypothetical protein